MIQDFFRWLIGYKYEWEEYHQIEYKNGTLFLFRCKKTGKFKKVWVGGW